MFVLNVFIHVLIVNKNLNIKMKYVINVEKQLLTLVIIKDRCLMMCLINILNIVNGIIRIQLCEQLYFINIYNLNIAYNSN